MTTPCLTDYISIDNLQTFLDESSQQDGVALRLWSPKLSNEGKKGWINNSWNNSCQFHKLIRTYPMGKNACFEFFENVAKEIIHNKNIKWYEVKCPTSLYIFGWPVYNAKQQVIAIIFGGLVRDPSEKIDSKNWQKVKENLKQDTAVIQELENEYCYAPKMSKKKRKQLFSKWRLFCQLLSRHLQQASLVNLNNDSWIVWLLSIHNCCTIASNLTKIKKIQKESLQFIIVDQSSNLNYPNYYSLAITKNIETEDKTIINPPDMLIPVDKNSEVYISFSQSSIKENSRKLNWKISKNIISGILTNNGSKNVTHRRLLLERQALVFKQVAKHAVTNLDSMINELFNQLRKVDVIDIDFASFSEVIYFSINGDNTKPCFKARVTYPKANWSKKQCSLIEELNLYTEEAIPHGSTVLAFQKSRSVLDRNTTISPTYVEVQPEVRSSLVIPINYGPLVLGVITFDSVKKDYFNDERMVQLENLTQLISPVVYHNKFQETLQKLNADIQVCAKDLTRKSKKIIRRHILKALCSLVQAEAASYWEQDKNDGKTLYRGTSIGKVDGFKCEMVIQDSSLGDLFKGRTDFILVADIEKEYKQIKASKSPDSHTLASLKYLSSRGIFSYLAFPVTINGKQVIISFYRFDNVPLNHREFSSIELNITQQLGKILSFYESLNENFDNHRHELEIQLDSRKELAITLAHNIKSPLSSTYARLDDMRRNLKKSIGDTYYTGNFNSLFNAINSNFSAIKRSTDPILKQLALQEGYNVGVFTIQPFHLYYDILTRQISRVRRGLKIDSDKLEQIEDPSIYKRIVEFTGHRQFPLLYGDKSAIEDMISNLLENAVKYSEKESKIFLETQFDYVTREIILLIKNEGIIYIPEDDKERIFEYAYRSSIARDKDPSSTGVGLYYSRYIAQQHGATLTVAQTSNPVILKLVIPINLLYSAEKAEETLSNSISNTGK